MQKIKLALILVVSMCASLAQAQQTADKSLASSGGAGVKSSILTVDELLRRENQALLNANLPAAATTASKVVNPTRRPSIIEVVSIFGSAGYLRTDLTVDGVYVEDARVGTRVGLCVIKAIANKCVVLEPARDSGLNQCATACWTGVPRESPKVLAVTPPLPTPLPAPVAMPAPMPPMPLVPAR
jgi:hypothetical protein